MSYFELKRAFLEDFSNNAGIFQTYTISFILRMFKYRPFELNYNFACIYIN